MTSGFICPDGAASPCGALDPTGSNPAWNNSIDIGTPPPGVPPAWYDQDATYTKAPSNTGVVCGNKGTDAATIFW